MTIQDKYKAHVDMVHTLAKAQGFVICPVCKEGIH